MEKKCMFVSFSFFLACFILCVFSFVIIILKKYLVISITPLSLACIAGALTMAGIITYIQFKNKQKNEKDEKKTLSAQRGIILTIYFIINKSNNNYYERQDSDIATQR